MLKTINSLDTAMDAACHLANTMRVGDTVEIPARTLVSGVTRNVLRVTKVGNDEFMSNLSLIRHMPESFGIVVLYPNRKAVNAWIRKQIAKEVNQEWAAEAAANEG